MTGSLPPIFIDDHTPYDGRHGVTGMARLAPAVLLIVLLAGCSDAPAATPGSDPGNGKPGVDCGDDPCDAPLTAASSIAAPTWTVGQWWEWQPADAAGPGEPFKSVVLSSGAGGSVVGTDSVDRAKQKAAFDHILLGDLSPTLAVTAWGGEWDLLSFPLTDGKTWSTSIPNIAWDIYGDSVDLDMRAQFDDTIDGFRFMGHNGDAMVLEGTYLPASGWFGELTVYDVDPGQDPLEFKFTAVKSGLNYTGSVFTAAAEPLLILDDENGFTDVPTEGGEPIVGAPQPHGTFTMAADTHLYGVMVAVGVIGGRVITLTDPANQQRQLVATGTPEDEQVLWIDEPGVEGQWTLATAGAGGFSGAFIDLYEVTVVETVL